jgi:hypothetical protein
LKQSTHESIPSSLKTIILHPKEKNTQNKTNKTKQPKQNKNDRQFTMNEPEFHENSLPVVVTVASLHHRFLPIDQIRLIQSREKQQE